MKNYSNLGIYKAKVEFIRGQNQFGSEFQRDRDRIIQVVPLDD